MCGAHRADVIAAIKARLAAGVPDPRGQHATGRGRRRSRFPRGLPGAGRARLHRPGRRALQPRRPIGRPGRSRGLRAARRRAAGTAAQGRRRLPQRAARPCRRPARPRPVRALLPPALLRSATWTSTASTSCSPSMAETLAVQLPHRRREFPPDRRRRQASVIVRYRGPDGQDDTVDERLAQLRRDGTAALADAQAPALHRQDPPCATPSACWRRGISRKSLPGLVRAGRRLALRPGIWGCCERRRTEPPRWLDRSF